MSERVTIEQLRQRARGVNSRLAGSGRGVVVEQRNGHIVLDEYLVDYTLGKGGRFDTCVRTITAGTKREVADFLHAMMVGIDLSRVQPEPVGYNPVAAEALGIDTSKSGWLTEYERRTKA